MNKTNKWNDAKIEMPHGYSVGDVIRMKDDPANGGFRCWKIIGVHVGGVGQESTYELLPLDMTINKPIQVPSIMLLNHTLIEQV